MSWRGNPRPTNEPVSVPVSACIGFDSNQAIQSALFANAHKKKGARSFKPGDFMPFHPGADGKARTAEQMKAKLGFLARMSKPKES